MREITRIESISQLHQILGLSPPLHPLISLIDSSNFKTSPDMEMHLFSIGFYVISLKEVVSGSFLYGRQMYDFQEGTLIFLAPEQVISLVEGLDFTMSHGWGLFIHPDLIRRSKLQKISIDYSFFSYTVKEALHLSDDEKETITSIVHKIEHEYSLNMDDYSHDLIVSNIDLLLNYCKRYYGRQFLTRRSRHKDIVNEFEYYLTNYIESDELSESGMPSVKDCAEAVHLSPNYLSDLLKKETGQSTQEFIHYYIIEKAKNKLLGCSSTIQEIAYELGFQDSFYFSKLFKKKTGMSPSEYRIMK